MDGCMDGLMDRRRQGKNNMSPDPSRGGIIILRTKARGQGHINSEAI